MIIQFIQIFILGSLSLIPLFGLLFLYYLCDKKKEKLNLLIITFISGIFTALPLIIVQTLGFDLKISLGNGILGLFYSLLFYAFFEEIIKLTTTKKVLDRFDEARDEITDGIMYAISVALGFVFLENIFILTNLLISEIDLYGFLIIFSFRSIGTALSHTVFSGIFGYFYAKACLDIKNDTINSLGSIFHDEVKNALCSIRSKICRKRFLEDAKLINTFLFGAFLSTSLHVFYNISLYYGIFGKQLTFIAFPLITLGALYLLVKLLR